MLALVSGREVRWIRRGQQLWATHRDEQSSGIMAGVGSSDPNCDLEDCYCWGWG